MDNQSLIELVEDYIAFLELNKGCNFLLSDGLDRQIERLKIRLAALKKRRKRKK